MQTISAPMQAMLISLAEFIPNLVQAIIVLVLSLWVARFAGRSMHRALGKTRADPELSLLISRVIKIGLSALGFVVALEQVDFDLTGFVTGLGIVGFTIGFALQDVSKNLIAGLLLLLQQPFDIGDAIEVSGFAGVVTHINLRATTLRTFDGVEVHIPNTDVYAKVVRVFAASYHRRLDLVLLTGDARAEEAKLLALDAVRSVPGVVHRQPQPRGLIQGIETAGSRVLVWFWVDLGEGNVAKVGDAVVRAVHAALMAEGHTPRSVLLSPPQPDVMGGARITPKAPRAMGA